MVFSSVRSMRFCFWKCLCFQSWSLRVRHSHWWRRGLREVEKAFQILFTRSNGHACPPCQPHNSRPEILGFTVYFDHLEKLFTRCDVSVIIAALFVVLICCNESSIRLTVYHLHRKRNWKQTTVVASTRRRVSPIPHARINDLPSAPPQG